MSIDRRPLFLFLYQASHGGITFQAKPDHISPYYGVTFLGNVQPPYILEKVTLSRIKRCLVWYHFCPAVAKLKRCGILRDPLYETLGLLNERWYIPNLRYVSSSPTTGSVSSSPLGAFLVALQLGMSNLRPGGFERPRGDLNP